MLVCQNVIPSNLSTPPRLPLSISLPRYERNNHSRGKKPLTRFYCLAVLDRSNTCIEKKGPNFNV